MKALKNKIYQLLIEKITVSEFENWLYNSEEILSKLNSNAFCFDVISIDYRSSDWHEELNKLIQTNFEDDYLEIIRIRKWCSKILKSQTFTEINDVFEIVYQNFDFDTEYSIYWEFYTLRDYFGLVEDGIWKVGTLIQQAKHHSNQTIKIIAKYDDFKSVKKALEGNLIPFKKETLTDEFLDKIETKSILKQTLKQKIFAFFKKI
ncbi:MAG: hypothetical protein EVB11_03825 [Winogradskyella sp.]|nr:MAG: hypothetical protein EVB11_03825 [Winogradskyella sp.]